MPAKHSLPAEALEERRFLSAASSDTEVGHVVRAFTARHAPAVADQPRVNTAAAQSEATDAEDAAPAAPISVTPSTASETEDQADIVAPSVASVDRSSSSSSVQRAIVTTFAHLPVRPAVIDGTGLDSRAILEDTSSAADAELSQLSGDAPRDEVMPVVFNTRRMVTLHDVDARGVALPLAALELPQAAAPILSRTPVIIKSTTDALLGLTRTDVLATFADAAASFAHESAAAVANAAGNALAAAETHYYKWEVTGTVLGIDALLVGHWYAIRRRRASGRAALPFSTRALNDARDAHVD